MNVTELLSFKPETPGGIKRKQGEDESKLLKKREKIQSTDEEADNEVETIDDTSVKKMVLKFEKRLSRNQELRIKFPENPEKFVESEVELNEILQEMHVLATVPDYFSIITELNTVQSLLHLLSHDNTDISIAAVDLLQELTEVDTLNENEDGAEALVESLLEGQVTALLIQNIERLDETVKEEADGVYNSLGVLENVVEFKPECSHDLASQGLLKWLLQRIKQKLPFDGNKLYASELLAILLQENDNTRSLLGEIEGIDVLLQQLNSYKRRDPDTSEEFECMENLFNALCSCLMYPPNKERFMRGEGLQLMNLLLREKRQSRNSAIKVLDYAMTGTEGAELCHKFVDILGLRTIFPIFMKTPKVNKKGLTAGQLEEHIVSIVASIVKACSSTQKQRILNKFVENDHEKVERLMELHFKYLERVRVCDKVIEREKRTLTIDDVTDEKDDEFYMRRLDSGLFVLQLLDYIMIDVTATGPSTIKSRVMRILNMRGESVKAIRGIMREYAGNIGETLDEKQRGKEQERIIGYLDQFQP
ncbi:beta-catenin-like protein 1 [Watersipora subatra]|uniref:beta-catenin-like protein 1 n=1 Tax=Watersipora subatra TaxID=2589382 RepID=UPI00355AF37F